MPSHDRELADLLATVGTAVDWLLRLEQDRADRLRDETAHNAVSSTQRLVRPAVSLDWSADRPRRGRPLVRHQMPLLEVKGGEAATA